MTDYHYTWLYWAYAIGMLIFAVPCQVLLNNDQPLRGTTARLREPFSQLLQKAYIAPAYIDGYFPQLCLAISIFSLGTSPMFFLLLMIRDLVGTSDPVQLQHIFSAGSIAFFISAAVATVVGGLLDKAQRTDKSRKSINVDSHDSLLQDPHILISRLQCVSRVGISYAIVAALLPLVCIFEAQSARIWAFYVCALLLGHTFGAGFARFQDITWQLIPAGVDVANAMGFNIMCRLFGVGIGNFIAGALLEFFKFSEEAHLHSTKWYNRFDTAAALHVSLPVYLVSSYIVCNIAKRIQLELDHTSAPAG
jgi:hypothetical protein